MLHSNIGNEGPLMRRKRVCCPNWKRCSHRSTHGRYDRWREKRGNKRREGREVISMHIDAYSR